MPPLDVGLIGCGRLAMGVHLPALLRLPQVRLAALAEADPERRGEAAARVPDARLYADFHDLLLQPGLQAVVVSLPTALHAEAAIAALRRRIHLYLEKPLAGSREEGRQILSAGSDSRAVAMLGFNYRFHPAVLQARELIRAGALGRVLAVQSEFSACEREPPAWKRHRARGGGVLLDLGSHHVDLARFLLGDEVVEVHGRTTSQRGEADTAYLQLRMEQGAVVQSFFSLSAVAVDQFRVFGTEGALEIDRLRKLEVRRIPGPGRGAPVSEVLRPPGAELRSGAVLRSGVERLRKALRPSYEPSYRRALESFFQAVAQGGPVRPDLADGLASLEVILAAEASAAQGGPVPLVSRDYACLAA